MNPNSNETTAEVGDVFENIEADPAPEARGAVTVVFFAAAIVLHFFLIRNYIAADFSRLFGIPFIFELLFDAVIVVGCVVCIKRKDGWRTPKGIAIVFVFFALYVAQNAAFYQQYTAAYLTGMDAQYISTAAAMIGLKAMLLLIGITAGIPMAAKIDKYEYARRLKLKVEQQNAAYAKEKVKEAKKDLEKTIANLRSSMTEEEFNMLIAEFKDIDKESPKEENTDGI